jgi:hypothetical protein
MDIEKEFSFETLEGFEYFCLRISSIVRGLAKLRELAEESTE